LKCTESNTVYSIKINPYQQKIKSKRVRKIEFSLKTSIVGG